MPNLDVIVLEHGLDRLTVTSDGGGLLEYSTRLSRDAPKRHVLRAASENPTGPLDRAMIVMAPWCNRISGGGFHFAGQFYPLQPNLLPFPMPVHGNAFQSVWDVTEKTAHSAEMGLESQSCEPFRYGARLRYELGHNTLRVELVVENLGAAPMVFSAGLHPWFNVTESTEVLANAAAFLESDSSGVPTGAVRHAPELSRFTSLPRGRFDYTLLDWKGTAMLRDPDFQVEVTSGAQYMHLFSPYMGSGYCCIEPQTAPPDAANLLHYRPTILEPKETFDVEMLIKFEHF